MAWNKLDGGEVMNVTLNYDTPIVALLISVNGLNVYPRYTGSITTLSKLINGDIIEIPNVPLQLIVENVTVQNSIYYAQLKQYIGFSSHFNQSQIFQNGTKYQIILSEILNNHAYFVFPLTGQVSSDYTITAGSSRWEVINMLAEEFGFTLEWNQVQNVYFVRPYEDQPCRSVTGRGFIKVSSKGTFNHCTVHNNVNEVVEVFTEDYFKVGPSKMVPIESTTKDRYNLLLFAEKTLKKERQNKQIITAGFPSEEYGDMVNEIGRCWDWNGVNCRVRSVSIQNGALVVVAGQENEEILKYNLDERQDLRGLPHIWV